MYSFYRAWLMHDAFQSSIGNPPDVLLQVGPTGTQFAAHRAILISHSGYFKSVFAHPTNPIVVPNVGVPEFTSLLTWMYTGFLDLNLENIYNILLATHLLHMPNALEICRNFLIQNNQLLNENRISTTNTTSSSASSVSFPSSQTPNTSVINQQTPSTSSSSTYLQHNIIKPIPSRKFLPDTFRNFLPILPTNLKTNENTSFHKIQTLATTSEQQPPLVPSSREDNNSIQQRNDDVQSPEIIDLKKRSSPEKIIEIVKVTSPKPSTSFHRKSPSLCGSLSPNLSEKSDAVILEYPPVKKYTKKLKQTQFVKSKSDKVIIDIACCDGPVRFHRVLNNCYGITNPTINNTTVTTTKIETNKTSDLMNKIMTHEMNNRRNKKIHENSDESSDIVYTCVYCNHTFKSQYCYQKHARRHINPVTLSSTCKVINNESQQQQQQQQNSGDVSSSTRKSSPQMANTIASDTSPVTQVNGVVPPATGTKREVKLLDMNVQYYPCKTCGSKFPSYYFVHKHRKMYHADEIEKESESGSQNADDAASKHTTASNSSPIPPNKENDV